MKEKIENKYLKVEINMHGGCLASIYDKTNNEELLYQVDSRAWKGQDICIFPFIARLKNKTYTYEGNEYHLENHGLCRYNDFIVLEKKEKSITIEYHYDENSLKQYPFKFRFIVIYSLKEKELFVTYLVKNIDNKTMYFGLGAHPALKIDYIEEEDHLNTDGNYIIFDEERDFSFYRLTDDGSFVISKEELGFYQAFETSKELIKEFKTLILDAKGIKNVTLHRKNGRDLIYHYHTDIDYIAIWSFPDYGDYICIEPWNSLPDFLDNDLDISKKKSLVHLQANSDFTLSYSLEIK